MATDLDRVQNIFDAKAREGHGDRMARGHWPFSSQILEKMALKPGDLFLDIGCGNGYAVRWAAEHVGPSGKATGVDLSPEMIALCQQQALHPVEQYQVANVEALPFDENTFDRILSVESIYYYPDIPKALAEVYRVLKPGGQYSAMVDFYRENPNSEIWQELMGVPMTYLSETDYQTLFEAAGFSTVRTERLYSQHPVDLETFQPGWGYQTPEDVLTFRRNIGSLAIWGQKSP